MKVLYNTATGRIFQVVRDMDWYWYRNTINVPFTVLELAETPENQALAIDMRLYDGRIDEAEEKKYSVVAGKVTEKPGWVEKRDDDSLSAGGP